MRTATDPSPWTVLGVAQGADHATIRRAYRRLALIHHPDRDRTAGAAERFQRVHAAYHTLLHAKPSPQAARPVQRAAHPAPPRHRPERPATAQERFLFRSLYATGLCFALTILGSVIAGIILLRHHHLHLLLALPGLAILPDSLQGLGMTKAGRTRPSMRS